jgi:hypothetical protein
MAKINARIAEGNQLAALFVFTVQKVRDQLAARPAELPCCWGYNKHLPAMNDIGAFGMVGSIWQPRLYGAVDVRAGAFAAKT